MNELTVSYDGPMDRLTRISDAMSDVLERHPEAGPNDKAIIFLDDGKMGGICIHGYDDMAEAMADLLVHLHAMFRAQGKTLDIGFVDGDGLTFVGTPTDRP